MSMAMEKEETEQTFDLFCTFILYSDIIAEENKSRYNMPILIRKKDFRKYEIYKMVITK